MKSILLLLLVSGILVSCLKSGSGSSVSEQSEFDLSTASGVMSAATSAVGSVGSVLTGGSSSLVAKNVLALTGPKCDGKTSDLLNDGSGVGEFIGCLLELNSKSPDTVQGSFHLVNEVIAMLEQQINFNYAPSYTTYNNISGTVDVSEGQQSVIVDVREKSVGSGPWNYLIEMCILSIDGMAINSSINDCINNNSFTFTMYLKDSSSQLAFKTITRMGSVAGTSFLIDSNSNELRFEGWDEGEGRHTRVYMNGVINTGYNIQTVSEIKVVTATEGIEDSGSGTDAVIATWDGSNLCMNIFDDNDNDHQNGAGTGTGNLVGQGTCGAYPLYDAGFFNASGLDAFISDETKGLLDFTSSSFAESSYFINI